MKILKSIRNLLVGTAILALVWQSIIWIGDYEEALLPGPVSVVKAVYVMLIDGTLFTHLRVSLGRFAAGYFLAVIPAIILGLLLGRSPFIWQFVDPIVQVLRPVSPVAWSPFIVLWFGIGNMPAIFIIFIAAFFPVLLTTVNGVRNMNTDYIKIAQNLEVGKLPFMYKFVLPAAFPQIMTGLHLAIATGWIFLVAGEMIGAQSGLGYLIVDARNMLNLDYVLAGIVAIGISGFLLDRLLAVIHRLIGRSWGQDTEE